MSPTQREFVRLKVMQALHDDPNASQRELSKTLGVSLGSVNYCLKSLVEKGLVKVDNFSKSEDKRGYAYYLTPAGIIEKTKITANFLKRKIEEYELLKQEISELQAQVEQSNNIDQEVGGSRHQ